MICQKIFILVIVFFAMPVCSMELSNALRCNISLDRDIVREQIQPLISLQDISRLKRASKTYELLCDVENICPLLGEEQCSIACKRLAGNYYACTKALGHFACNDNQEMFKHLWAYHGVERDNDMRSILGRETFTLYDQIKVYKKHYSKAKGVRKRTVQYAVEAIDNSDVVSANRILSGGSVSIFDLIHKFVGVKKLFCGNDELDIIFYQVCQLGNADLIKALCGGIVDERSFEYIVSYVGAELMMDLISKGILPANSVNKSNKTSVLHVAARRGFQDVIKTVLDTKEVYVNCHDENGQTPLHCAVQHGQLGAVLTILSNDDADVHFKDNRGNKAVDYTKSTKMFFLSEDVDEVTTKKAIREILKIHAEKSVMQSYSSSKVNHNGYESV